MIRIYGSPGSSAGRCYWTLEEVGAAYERVPLSMKEKEHKSEAYLKLNPNGKVPTVVDGDFVIWESVAAGFYIAEKHKPELLGGDLQARALVRQWSIWAMTELQPPMVELLIQLVFVPEEKRDLALIERARKNVGPRLKILNQALSGKAYIVGTDFSLADINLATVVFIAKMVQVDLSEFIHITNWLDRLGQRPALQRVQKL